MPTYEYACKDCKHRTTAVRSVEERNNGPDCCNGKMEKHIFTAPAVEFPMWDVDYFCPALGQGINSMKQRKYLMDSKGLMDADEFGAPDMEAEAERGRQMHESAAQEQYVPPELKDAMVREGLDGML